MYKSYLGLGIVAILFINRKSIYNWLNVKKKSVKKSVVVYFGSILDDIIKDLVENPNVKQQIENLLAEVINNVMLRTDINRSLALQSYDILNEMMSKPISKIPCFGNYLSSAVNSGVIILKNTVK